MIKEIIERFKQGRRTMPFPSEDIKMPPRYLGLPVIKSASLSKAAETCPYGAISYERTSLDLGRCVFCGACAKASPEAVTFSTEYRMAVSRREALSLSMGKEHRLAEAMSGKLRSAFGRSFRLREVSAGGCNACEADCNVLGTIGFDLGRFGIQFVASPRHADGILVTGPVTRNMQLALKKTYEAVPAPKVVIACGACAIGGGPYAGHEECPGIPGDIPVDLYIPGCPPHPLTILDGLLRFLGKVK